MPKPSDCSGHAPGSKVLHAFSSGILFNKHIRRILELAGYDTRFGLPKPIGATVIYADDAFFGPVRPGRSGAPPLGLLIDRKGAYFDNTQASELEDLLNYSDLSSPDLQTRAKRALRLFQSVGLSEYNAFDTNSTLKQSGYILVADQTRNDTSIQYGGANTESFVRMLAAAKAENPGNEILVKTSLGHHDGHFSHADTSAQVRFISPLIPVNSLIKKAKIIYCVTSPIGFEAILSGHRPRVFGAPFYGGWGLSDDEHTHKRRARTLNMLELFAATMMLYPSWFDPYRNELCDFETVILNLKSQVEAWRQDQDGYTLLGMHLWKRGPLRRFFRGAGRNFQFVKATAFETAKTDRTLIWAGKETPQIREYFAANGRALLRLEDGFLRSRGLGANLVPPMSLIVDDLGIYYDPNRESRLENLLNSSINIDENQLARAKALQKLLINSEVSKYNTGASILADNWPCDQQKILVPGQVEDDASIRFGAGNIRRNIDLLTTTRQQNPDAFIVYKPHPDVEAGLRPGKISDKRALQFADVVLNDTDAISAINACDNVSTITSLLGFEALIRGKHVTCHGLPFYAGWGLTTDLGPSTARRAARPTITAMIHCALIAYPRYFDPKTGLACPVEVVVERLCSGDQHMGGPANRLLSKLQTVLASASPIWR